MKNTILIIDDDPTARETLHGLLFHEGYDLAFASNGKEGLAKAQALRPSVILTDVMMPEMDGFELCQRLRALPSLAEVPIIMITGLDDRDSRLLGIRAGADDFLGKPFDRAELRARLRTIVRLNRYRRLHTERAKFEWVVQHANNGYVMINRQGALVYANAIAALFLELPETSADREFDAPDANFLDVARRHYLLEPQEAWQSWPAPAPGARYLVKPETPERQAFWLQVELLQLPEEADDQYIIRLDDVTSTIKAQRSEWGFHSLICHKLRTPLVGILGGLDFLSSQITRIPMSDALELLEVALTSARRLHAEIEDILQYLAAPDIAGVGMGCPIAEVAAIVTEICASLQLQPVKVATAAALEKALFSVSPAALELILREILENAVKFHPARAPEIIITIAAAEAQTAIIQIQDNGRTLAPNQLAQMWMPYYQGEKYFTGETEGMGLGLAMVASVVWGVGGACRSYNRTDQAGIVVELTLPLDRVGEAALHSAK